MAVASDHCELWANKMWVEISIDDALASYSGRKLRCRECNGAVRAHKEGDGNPAHFEHLEAHQGCSKSFRYSGTPSRHPRALA